jgi:hypothetical protein
MKPKILLIGLLALPMHIVPVYARGGGSAIVTPNFVSPLPSVAPLSTVGILPSTNNPFATGMTLNNGLVPRSTSPIVPPLIQTPLAVTTSVLTNMGNGTFSVQTVLQTGGLFSFSSGTMTPFNGRALVPDLVVTPRHEMTQSKLIVFE